RDRVRRSGRDPPREGKARAELPRHRSHECQNGEIVNASVQLSSRSSVSQTGAWWRRWTSDLSGKLFFIIPTVIVGYLVLPPLILLLVATFKATGDRLPTEPAPWTLQNYITAFSDPETFILFQNSLIFAFASVAIAITIAAVLVWL